MGVVSLAVIKLSLIAVLGFYLFKKRIIKAESLDFLTFFIINISVPALIFSHLISNDNTVLSKSLWHFILLSIVVFGIGYGLSIVGLIGQPKKSKGEFISLVSIQNAGYLPMNIALFLFPESLRQEFLVYVFLYLLGFNVIMWSVGSFLIFKGKNEKFRLKSIFTPPITSTILALAFIYLRLADYIPSVVLSPIKMVGQTSFVLSVLVLGCWLAKVNLGDLKSRLFLLLEASFLKLIILPFLLLIFVLGFDIVSLFGLFIILQASMPSATTLPIIASLRGADSEFISQGVFLSNIFSIATIPFWLGLYLKFSGYSF